MLRQLQRERRGLGGNCACLTMRLLLAIICLCIHVLANVAVAL
jgi:hypothetical protein